MRFASRDTSYRVAVAGFKLKQLRGEHRANYSFTFFSKQVLPSVSFRLATFHRFSFQYGLHFPCEADDEVILIIISSCRGRKTSCLDSRLSSLCVQLFYAKWSAIQHGLDRESALSSTINNCSLSFHVALMHWTGHMLSSIERVPQERT